ncbi:MAG: tRNA adenosine(34) deaminase TadA [Clostridia bacterium]|nr:tRNA adenosine(34) deaminase TadA [Clostridia bacterium]
MEIKKEESTILSDTEYMREALALADKAMELDEVPIGAVVVWDGRIVGRGFNNRESSRMATHHAEILAIEDACRALGGWRLHKATLYVTLEPCAMCAGAIINARIPRVVYGACDLRFGALGSLVDLSKIPFNHIPEVEGGVLRDECSAKLSDYFRKKRSK